MMRHVSVDNRLLASLPQADYDLLAPHLQTIPLRQDTVLVQSGDRLDNIYFLHSGAVAFMLDMPSGQTVATAMVGVEGAVGALAAIGASRSAVTAVVRIGGSASQISAAHLQAVFARSEPVKQMVRTHTTSLLMQIQHVSACNALHPVEERTARWLLHIQDHAGDERVPVTQETLAHLLGVRRTTITLVMRKLREGGAIRSDQRGLVAVNRPRLEQAACECYALIRRELEEIFPAARAASCRHTGPVRVASRRMA